MFKDIYAPIQQTLSKGYVKLDHVKHGVSFCPHLDGKLTGSIVSAVSGKAKSGKGDVGRRRNRLYKADTLGDSDSLGRPSDPDSYTSFFPSQKFSVGYSINRVALDCSKESVGVKIDRDRDLAITLHHMTGPSIAGMKLRQALKVVPSVSTFVGPKSQIQFGVAYVPHPWLGVRGCVSKQFALRSPIEVSFGATARYYALMIGMKWRYAFHVHGRKDEKKQANEMMSSFLDDDLDRPRHREEEEEGDESDSRVGPRNARDVFEIKEQAVGASYCAGPVVVAAELGQKFSRLRTGANLKVKRGTSVAFEFSHDFDLAKKLARRRNKKKAGSSSPAHVHVRGGRHRERRDARAESARVRKSWRREADEKKPARRTTPREKSASVVTFGMKSKLKSGSTVMAKVNSDLVATLGYESKKYFHKKVKFAISFQTCLDSPSDCKLGLNFMVAE